MNGTMIIYLLGWVMNLEAAFMLLPCLTALIYRESAGFSFLIVAFALLIAGVLCTFRKPANKAFYAREGFAVVALSWILLSVTGALPFVISGEIPHFIDAMFETVSGFTTTGSSILTDVEALSRCMLFWRSFTHWIGGMGVLVFMLAIVPMAGGQSIHLLRAESPGPAVSKLVPRLRGTATILYGIYLVMTVAEILLLLATGMPVFDSITIAFGTAGTGGFAILNSGLASYTVLQQGIVTVFMILFGINFNVYFLLLIRRRPKEALKSEEMRWYLIIIAAAIGLITLNVRGLFSSWWEAFHHTAFQVASIITTTGFSTSDFNLWPGFSRTILVLLMFVGACAGSTGGGIKVSRIVVAVKAVAKELARFIHPRNVRMLKLEGKKVEHETLRTINIFLTAYFLLFALSTLLISLDNFDLITSFTSVAATLNNIGPGLEIVGPMSNFSAFSGLSKCVLMFDMLAGRLELFPMLLLFVPATWKRN